MDTKIDIFKGRKVRKTIYRNEWWFVVEDVVAALIDSNDPEQYVGRMKQRDSELAKGWVQIVHTLVSKNNYFKTSENKRLK
jgi:DNA-damage-inducible protein D